MTKYTKLALTAAGVAASVACANKATAQSDDALLNKLVQKGILTEAEAKDLSKENDREFSKNLSANLGLPAWVSSFKLNGDFRGRLDYLGSDNSAFTDRYRLRYRVRAGITAKLQDDFEVGLTLGSGDSGGNALSNNTTLENNGTKKPIWIDKAYAKWTPIHDGEWTLGTTIGKMGNPFQLSAMVFDPDYTPEGGALQAGYKINDQHSLQFNTAGFVVDELGGSSHDPYLLGAQALWNARWSSKVDSSVGIAAFGLGNRAGNDAALANGNTGNTQNNFNPYVLSGSATYKLDHFPLFPGECPIKLAGEYMDNPAVSSNGEGYSIGATLGKAGKRGTWDLSYRYQRLEADAWYEGFVDDDNVAYNGGMIHGTNIKGHLVKLNYALTDALTFTFTGYFNDLINAGPANNGGTHIMADLMWKF